MRTLLITTSWPNYNTCFFNTWFTVHGTDMIAATSKGTRPGDPLADLLFAVSQTLILTDIEGCLHSIGALLPIPVPEHPILATLADCIDVKLVDSTLDDHVVLLTVVPRHMDSYSFMSWIQSIISYIDKAFLNR